MNERTVYQSRIASYIGSTTPTTRRIAIPIPILPGHYGQQPNGQQQERHLQNTLETKAYVLVDTGSTSDDTQNELQLNHKSHHNMLKISLTLQEHPTLRQF